MSRTKIIVIGGGASGLIAAGQAALQGGRVVVLEKMKQPGRKLCITGKGRCNLTNIAEISDFISHFGPSGKFLRQAFNRFFNTDTMAFFNELGLELVTERGGRVFPAGGNAFEVRNVLVRWLEQCNVQIRESSAVTALQVSGGRITGVCCHDRILECEAVILATGGASYPATGSTGDGYNLAASVGHTIVSVRPALVPLETAGKAAAGMSGLNLRNCRVKLYINGKKIKEAFGEMTFTDFGVTGPVILTLSGYAVDALQRGDAVTLAVDLKPALDDKKLDNRLCRDFETRGKEQLDNVLRGLLPREMISICLEQTNIAPDRNAGSVPARERKRLHAWLKDFRLTVTGYRPFAEAIITAGGVDIREIEPRTMESRLVKGLFIAGELLDLQADTGGYNLQAAFSTGWLAGRSAAGTVS